MTLLPMKKFNYLKSRQTLIAGVAIVLLSTIVNLYDLSSITKDKLSIKEIITKHQLYINSPWWRSMNHFYGPYYLLMHVLFSIDHNSVFTFRLASAVVVIVSSLLLFIAIKINHRTFIAFLSSLIYMTLIPILIISHQALTISSQLLLIPAWLIVLNLIKKHPSFYSLLIYILVLCLLIYVPGGIWFSLILLAYCFEDLVNLIRQLPLAQKIIAPLILLIFVAPIAYRLAFHFSNKVILKLVGYSLIHARLMQLILDYVKNIFFTLSSLFVYAKVRQSVTLGHLMVFPIAVSIIILIGVIYYLKHLNNRLSQLWFSLLLISLALVGLGQMTIFLLIPLFIVTLSGGLSYLLKSWQQIFPYNPYARAGGIILILIGSLLICFYGLRGYFIAYKYDPAISQQFSYKLN